MNNQLYYDLDTARITADPWGRNGIRIRIAPKESRQTSDWALDIPLEAQATIHFDSRQAVLRNGDISVVIQDTYTQKGSLQFFKHDHENTSVLLAEQDYGVWAHNPGAHTFKPVANGLYHTELHLASREGERFYGMGENATGRVDLKGSVIDLYQRHVKAVVPFVVSSEGYGFLWNNPSLGRVEFGNNMTRWVSYGCKQIDFYITTGDSYAEIMENYADATGHTPVFPYWASGFWQCKLRYENQREFMEIAREFKKQALPLSVLVIDFLHWDAAGNWKLDPTLWPDPKAMIQELAEMGVRVMVSPWTLVDESSENFQYMKEHNLFTTSLDGTKDKVDFFGPKYQYDPTNPEAAKFLWEKWKKNYFDLGIRTFWLDPCDEFHDIQDYDQVVFHIGPAVESHSFFVVAHQKNVYQGQVAAGETEVVNISRNAWAGSQRYGACPAPHDILSSFEHLEQYMKVGLNVMMSGIPWWSCDIGGFITNDSTSDHFHELMVRWYQYGVFLPIFRTHGYRPYNEAWRFGDEAYRHIRNSMMLRERLRPYVMDQMELARKKGLPPMRPLFFDFSEDPETYAIEDEFLFGPTLLIAPITKFNLRSRTVYLPRGNTWTNAWTNETTQGGQSIEVQAPLDYIPVFVKESNSKLLSLFKK